MMKFYQTVCKIESVIARVAIFGMVFLVFASVIARNLDHPINWAMDISTFLFAWSCFLSADMAWRENKLMSVDLLVKKFSLKVQRIIQLFNYIILTAFLLYFVVFGIWLSITTWARSFQGIPGFSYTWVTLSAPVGGFLLLISTILKLKDLILIFINNNMDPENLKLENK